MQMQSGEGEPDATQKASSRKLINIEIGATRPPNKICNQVNWTESNFLVCDPGFVYSNLLFLYSCAYIGNSKLSLGYNLCRLYLSIPNSYEVYESFQTKHLWIMFIYL